MQYILEHFGVAVAAITGVLAARGKKVDLFGVIVLAIVTAFGGGTVRDLCLGSLPVFWIQDPRFLLNAAGVAVATFFVARFPTFKLTALLVADAFALALFTLVGAEKSMHFTGSASIVVTMGVITGVAGGMLRDVLTGEVPLILRTQIYLYATAALVGTLAFVALNTWLPDNVRTNMIAAIVITLALRIGAIRWKLTLPEFEPKTEE